MVWADDLSPAKEGWPVESRFIEGRKVPATNKPGQGFIFLRYISAAAWRVEKSARKRRIELGRARGGGASIGESPASRRLRPAANESARHISAGPANTRSSGDSIMSWFTCHASEIYDPLGLKPFVRRFRLDQVVAVDGVEGCEAALVHLANGVRFLASGEEMRRLEASLACPSAGPPRVHDPAPRGRVLDSAPLRFIDLGPDVANPRHKHALLILDGLCGEKAYCRADVPTLAAAFGCRTRNMQVLLGEMERAGWIDWVADPRNRMRRIGVVLRKRADPSRPVADSPDRRIQARADLEREATGGPGA